VPGVPPLDDATLDRVGRALGHFLLEREARPRVLIGMDTRESGPHIAQQIAAGLAAEGAAAKSAGVLTTPGVAYLVRSEGFSAGVVISASHNPYHDNGVKLFAATGMKFPDEVEERLERDFLRSRNRQKREALICNTRRRCMGNIWIFCARGQFPARILRA